VSLEFHSMIFDMKLGVGFFSGGQAMACLRMSGNTPSLNDALTKFANVGLTKAADTSRELDPADHASLM